MKPASHNDDTQPVELREPVRRQTNDRADAATNLWRGILLPGEVLIWQGQRQPLSLWQEVAAVARFPVVRRDVKRRLDILAVVQFFYLGLLAFVLTVRRIGRILGIRSAADRVQPQDCYALTDRACYLACSGPQGLTTFARFPITPKLRLGLGGRSVTFASVALGDGAEEPIGFQDIPDSEAVYALIREVQAALI